jgi:acyl-CoA synthetase (AMP-forming)/AMP-acid ligase II
MTLTWAIHRLNGISSPANAAYSADELTHQLTNSGASCLFTVVPLLPVALDAAAKAGIPRKRIYICDLPDQATGGAKAPKEFKTLTQLMNEGSSLPNLEPIKWSKGQGARQTAFLCYSSGTSGLPVSGRPPLGVYPRSLISLLQKGVMVSHRNVITNTIQISKYDESYRAAFGNDYTEVVLGLLPYSHIYGLVVVCMASIFRGDQVIVLPKFDLQHYLQSIVRYKINTLYLVPPIIIAMVKNEHLLKKYDLSSVRTIFTGAAPLGQETAEALQKQYPSWHVRQGYGLTETCTVVSSTHPIDVWFGSSGCLIAGMEVKLMSAEGNEITGYDQPGELWVKSPSVVLGYLKNDKANKETFVEDHDGRFMRTGDEAVFRLSSNGNEHIWIVDRIKELIKVKVRLPISFNMIVVPGLIDGIAGSSSCPCRARSLPSRSSGRRRLYGNPRPRRRRR